MEQRGSRQSILHPHFEPAHSLCVTAAAALARSQATFAPIFFPNVTPVAHAQRVWCARGAPVRIRLRASEPRGHDVAVCRIVRAPMRGVLRAGDDDDDGYVCHGGAGGGGEPSAAGDADGGGAFVGRGVIGRGGCVSGAGEVVYVPDGGARSGDDQFTFVASNGYQASQPATVAISVYDP